MRIVLRLALAMCVALAPCAGLAASAQAPWYRTLQPWRPSGKVYENQTLCAPFNQNLYAQFEGRPVKSLQEIWPEATLISLDKPDEGSRGFTLDFDHDGDLEVMLVDSYNIGWRYLGINLYVFDTEADYAIAVADRSHYNHYGNLDLNGNNDKRVEGASYVEFGEFRDETPLIAIGDGYYIVTRNSVIQLNAKGRQRTICEFEMDPARGAYDAFFSQLPFLQGYAAAFGEPSCSGTMGWRGGDRVEDPFHDILSRPWAIREAMAQRDPSLSLARADAARELRYLSWGARDPQSWIDYMKGKEGRVRFVAELRSYYLSHPWFFKMNEVQATEVAEAAWRMLLDGAYYAHVTDDYELTSMLAGADTIDLPITADTPAAEIARIAIEAWLKAHPAGSSVGENDPGILTSALLVAVETRQPMETIRTLADRRDEAFAASGKARGGWWRYSLVMGPGYDPPLVRPVQDTGEKLPTMHQIGLDQALSASLGHAGLTSFFLERGANPSARTNWFGKTPLMYAVQHDKLNAVRLLLSHGADTRKFTDGEGRYCHQLDRDHRTALMYAAENASPAVIEAILAAGADVSAKDTKGNSALWYFGRNAKITDSAVRARISARLGG
jgi:hypothetical protein